MAQGSEEPPFLRVGTEVSAKYRGAFCEASIKTVKKHVKCKIQYKDNSTATLTDDVVKGDLKIGSDVVVKTLDGRLMDGVIIKLTDASTYTVVFDDGDERTLRRTSLCLKGGRHFNESETLDHLPLTDPENFGTPVIQNGKKRKKRRPSAQQSSFEDGDSEKEESSPIPTKKKCSYNDSILGKVIIVERGARRKSHWFPALGVSPSQENLMYIKSKDQCLVRSFKDGNYHVINVRDTKEFSKDQEPVSSAMKSDSRTNKPGIERAVAYLETGRVPSTWEGSKSEVITYDTDDETKKAPLKIKKPMSSDDDNDESSDDDSEREAFVEKLQIFMEKQGTPLVRNPVLGNQDLDLHKLYLLVMESGGMEEVTKKQEWRNIYSQMGIAIMPPSASHHIKMAYKKYLHPYELHESDCRTIKDSDEEKSSNKKDKPTVAGRTRLERRSLSKALEKSTAVDKRVKPVSTDMAEKPNNIKPVLPNKPRRASTPNKPAVKQALSPTSNKPSTKPAIQASTPPSKPNKLPLSSSYSTSAGKHATTPTGKSKSLISRQSSKSSTPDSHKEPLQEHKEIDHSTECRNGTVLKQDSEDGRRNYKHEESLESDIDVDEDVTSPDSELAVDVVNSPGCMSDTSESRSDTRSDFGTEEAFECTVGDKIQVKYGRGRNRRLYEAKVVTVDPDAEEGLLYLIHYTGWNTRYDEWISPDRIIGKSNKVSKKKGPAPKEAQKNKPTPKLQGKQLVRSQSKRGTKSPSPASPGGKPSDVKPSNGNKTSHRDSPPLEHAPSPSSMKQTTKNGTTTRRTRSDRNSFSSNGLDEAVKSPPSKRRQKSLTPEPELAKTSESSKENQICVQTTEGSNGAQGRVSEATEPLIKEEKAESLDNDCEESNDQKAESKSNELVKCHEKVNYNSKLRPWSKLPNGIINYSSSESGSPEHLAAEIDAEPSTKKVKVEKEIDKEEIEKLLNAEVEGKEPISAPHSQGSCTSDTQSGNSSSTHEDRQKTSSPVDSEQKASSSDNSGEAKSNSSEAENSKEEKSDNKEESKTEKKENDHRGKRHRKKKERKRQRQHSMNENSNDGCSSNASPSSKSSPTRPKICFNADLESIKSMEDGSERIRLLQLKINEMRKLYGSLKAEVASIDRKRKKLKKKREESGSHDSKTTCVSSSPATVECR